MLSSSDSSTITFLREAARRDGLVGDMVAMDVDRCVVVAIFSRRALFVYQSALSAISGDTTSLKCTPPRPFY